jgi:hypothetical protein
MSQRIAVFLTTEVDPARILLGRILDRHPDDVVVAYVSVDAKWLMKDDLEYCVVRSDKPVGGKAEFVRSLRKDTFDVLYVAWHGGDRPQPLRLVALVAGARRTVAIDEFDREFDVALLRPGTWLRHGIRRATSIKVLAIARWLAAGYRFTVGLIVAFRRRNLAAARRRP